MVSTGATVLLLGNAAPAEDVLGEGLLPRGTDVVGGEEGAKTQVEVFVGRDEPPSFCRQSLLVAAEGETATDARQRVALVELKTLLLLLVVF